MPGRTVTTTVSTFDRTPEQRRRELEDARMRRQPRAHWDPEYYADPRNASAARSILSPMYGQEALTQSRWQRAYIHAQASMFGPGVEQAMYNVLAASPTVSPGVATSLAMVADRFHIPDALRDEILTLDAESRTLEPELTAGRRPDHNSEAEKGTLAQILGGITRPVFALASMPLEMVQGMVRSAVGQITGGEEYEQGPQGELVEAFQQTLGGQYLTGLFSGESADMGDGYIPRGDVHARQVQATRNAAPLINNHAWTLGRGIGSLIYDDPDSLAFRNLSGIIDLTAAIAMDPLVFAGKGAMVGRGLRAGQATGARVKIGQEVAGALAEREARATLEAANETTRQMGLTYAKAQHDAAVRMASLDEEIDVAARLDRVLDSEDVIRAEMANPLPARDVTQSVDEAVGSLGTEGLDALTAKVVADSPELPGAFTDAIPMAGTSRVLPGADDGVDAIITYHGPDVPNLRSVDDMVDNAPQLASAISSQVGRSVERTRAISAVVTELRKPQVTYADVLSTAADKGVGGPLLNALRESDIDGITDVFRLTDGEGGVWWTSRDYTAATWSEDGWRVKDTSPAALQRQLDAKGGQRKDLLDQAARARRKRSDLQRRVRQKAETYAAAADARTSQWDRYDAVNYAVETGMGVRRNIEGKPEISYDLLKEALFGPVRSFDQAIGAGKTLPSWVKISEGANRLMVGTMTLGVSEAVRLARKTLIQPFMARTTKALIDTLVKADEGPQTLGMLQRLTNGKVDPEILKALQRAKTEEQVLETLGPALGVGITRPITSGVLQAQRIRMSAVNGGRANDHLFRKAQQWMIDYAERAGSVAPRMGAHINLADPVGSSLVLRNYLDNLPHLETAVKDRLIGTYLEKTTEVGRAETVRRVMDTVADELAYRNDQLPRASDEVKGLLRDSLRTATRIYAGGRSKANAWWLDKYSADAKVGFTTADGQLIHLTGPQLEAELARGGMVLPEMREVRDAVGRWGLALQTVPGLRASRDILDKGMDFWRSAVLFRYAYTVRNIAEMQFRMFLTGHRSIFNDPMGSLAMASAMQRNTAVSRGFFARMARYNRTADGKVLRAEEPDDLTSADDTISEWVDVMSRTTSHHDMRSMRAMEAHHGVTEVAAGQPGFTAGWADQLLGLHHSKLTRLVAGQNTPEIEAALARGVDRKDAVVDWILTSKSGVANRLRREYAEAGVEYARIFSDRVALRSFLFDSEASIANRVKEYSAGHDDLVEFIATGQLFKEGDLIFSVAGKSRDPELTRGLITGRNSRMAAALRSYHDTMPEDFRLRLRVFSGKPTDRNKLSQVFDTFFAWNARKENAWAMGPEFAYKFNDASVRLMPAMTMADRQRMFDFIKKAEGRFRPHSEILIQARRAMKAPDGSLNMADVERVAGAEASQHVKTLFYDALQRKQIFHQLRLVMPFAQPFVNTLWTWGRLAAARPYMMEKMGRVAVGLSEPGSGVIYDDFDAIDPFTDRQSRDPTQGFIYKNEFGEDSFAFPLIGSALGAVLSPVTGFNASESMQLTAPVQNLNLAFQGDVDYLPGVGPLISFPLSQLMPEDAYGTLPEWIRDYVFPYGEPHPEQGVVESTLLPSWARRLTGALWNEDFRSYSYRGLLPYFASTGEYPGLVSDPQVRQKLIDDVQGAARWLTFIRAVGAAILPAAPTQEIYAADKDGRLIGTVYLASAFRHLQQESNYDFEASTKAFIDAYGMQALAAIVPSSEGDTTLTGPAWDFMRKHGSDAKPYADVLGLFFPGDYSFEAARFQEESGDRRRLKVQERVDKMIAFLYGAEKRQLEGKAAIEEWSVDDMDNAEADLQRRYGGVIPQFTGEDSGDKLDKVRRALDHFEELRETRAGQGTMLLFDAYDKYEDISQDRYEVGLAGQKATSLREEFLAELDQISSEYGGQNKAGGSVDTIARLFVNVVTPRRS